jgi:hypothetical protein
VEDHSCALSRLREYLPAPTGGSLLDPLVDSLQQGCNEPADSAATEPAAPSSGHLRSAEKSCVGTDESRWGRQSMSVDNPLFSHILFPIYVAYVNRVRNYER